VIKNLGGASMALQLIINEQILMPDYPIYINNSGLILLSPFLPALFEELDLLSKDDDKTYLDPATSASRAVHLLQYLVTGHTESLEEYLTLNKLICGLPVNAPVTPGIEATTEELETCDSLLQAVLDKWLALGSGTSIETLRASFLQRDGSLKPAEERWEFRVQRNTLDVLLDRIPWGFSIISHPWMAEPIYVEW